MMLPAMPLYLEVVLLVLVSACLVLLYGYGLAMHVCCWLTWYVYDDGGSKMTDYLGLLCN